MSRHLVPHLNVWIEFEEQVVLSGWRIALLQAIAATGSITGAAEYMDVPYRVAWSKVKEMEQGLGVPLIETRTGGADGGGATLTPVATDYITRYAQMCVGLEALVQQRFAEFFTDVT
jgi:molybdate transport system regulatory protein